jgi:hypothetical protein
VWDGANWQDVTPNPIKSYATDAALLAAVDPAGTYATTQDTGNLYIRRATGWLQINVRQFPNYAAMIADTDAPVGTEAELVDEGAIFERRNAGGGGQALTAGATANYQPAAVAEPAIAPNQTGVWLDITTETNFRTAPAIVPGGWPYDMLAPATITIPMSDGSNRVVTLPAKTYPDAVTTDGGSATAANSMGWQLFYDYLNGATNPIAPIVGFMLVQDGNNLYLRVDVPSNATVWPVGAPTTGTPGQNWVATTVREFPNYAAVQTWAGDVASNIGDRALALDTGIHYTRLAAGWRADSVWEDTEATIRAATPANGQEAYATDTNKRFVYVGGQWVEDPIQHYATDALLQAATPPDGTLAWADDTANIYARAGGAWVGTTTGFADPIPIGTIMAFPTRVMPAGWLRCQGQAVPAGAQFDELRNLLGAGNNIPNLRGRFLRGARDAQTALTDVDWSTARPRTPFTTDRQGDHDHGVDIFLWAENMAHEGTDNLPGGVETFGNWGTDHAKADQHGAIKNAGAHTHTITGGGDTETAPEHTLVEWCIKATHSTILPPVFANNINAPANGEVLTWDATNGQWVNLPPGGGFAPTITTPADGEAIVYDGATATWVNKTAAMRTQTITQAAYDALNPKDPTTLYLING